MSQQPEILIDRPVDWLQNHSYIWVHGKCCKIKTANRHGDVRLAGGREVNIGDDFVKVECPY